MTSDGTRTFGYDYSNRLTSVSGGVGLVYDPAGRLVRLTGTAATVRFQYDGVDMIAEYNTSGVLQRRYVHGPGTDEPLVEYAGSGTGTRLWLIADERGSIVARTNQFGNAVDTNSYDEYGLPGASNAGRYGYTGQVWLEETGLYHYKNRAYNPRLGRFMQTDPIGQAGGVNIYAYVGGDPVNYNDPLGLRWVEGHTWSCSNPQPGTVSCRRVATRTWIDDALFEDTLVGSLDGTFGASSVGPSDLSENTSNQTQCPATTGAGATNWPVAGNPYLTPAYGSTLPSRQGTGGYHSRTGGGHDGIDIQAPVGSNVSAVANGTIVGISANPSLTYGQQIVIDMGNGLYAQYAHLSGSLVSAGDRVSRGQTIGRVGISGNAGDVPNILSHLHFEIRQGSPAPVSAGGRTIDPEGQLPPEGCR